MGAAGARADGDVGESYFAAFNTENFYLLLDKDYDKEELEGLDEEIYLSMNLSIYNEDKERSKIGGMESLANFNRIYPGGRYDSFRHEKNSRQGIFAGALAKRGAFSRVVAKSMPGLLPLRLGTEFRQARSRRQ